ncbi:hypothetical protein ARAM_001188 [Aspergillus rambellii]|uniref:MIP transporter n=1 Tax=Aspergillus rambellii TaxID=308745 RepID=A0A0F8TZU8_9EURO|nr:hypothetical protein ARAM_001188 [Aspergillus rambellii]
MGSITSPGEEEYRTGGLQDCPPPKPSIQPFAGRIGGNQGLVLDRSCPENEELLKRVPDAAPLMTFQQRLEIAGFYDLDLWKFGLIECIGSLLFVFLSSWIGIRRPVTINANTSSGIFSTAAFLGPLVGGLSNWLFLTVFIFAFANASGSHLNPTITVATFFGGLITFPRMVIYLLGQTLGGAVAGFMLRTGYGSRDFTVGGCWIDPSQVPVNEAFMLEFTFSLALIFLAFGVGLDPRQGQIYGPALSAFLVGLVLCLLTWGSSFTRDGYAGASMNASRCFGVYTATTFPGYHWIHWVGPIVASMAHGVVYAISQNMAWSFALPQAVFASPFTSTLTPIVTGSLVGYVVNRGGTKTRYANLQQPPFAPPAWLFAPAWTILYGLMGYAAHHATINSAEPYLSRGQTLYTTQLVLNHLWMPLFFGIRKPDWAAADILLLGANVGTLLQNWWSSDRTAFWLLVPYAAWLGYATYLNIGVGVLNRWRVGE